MFSGCVSNLFIFREVDAIRGNYVESDEDIQILLERNIFKYDLLANFNFFSISCWQPFLKRRGI